MEIAKEFCKDFDFIDYAKAFAYVDCNKLEKRQVKKLLDRS